MNFFSRYRNVNKSSDEQLIALFKENGSIDFSSELFLRYKDLIYGVCLKYLKDKEKARDTSMEIFEELHRKLEHHDIKNFKSWLYTLVRNHCLMQLRSAQRHIQSELIEENINTVMENEDELHLIEEKEIEFMKLESAIDDLEEKQGKCLKMFYLQEMSYQDIVETTGFDINKVKSYIQNGKRNLKNKLIE